jgi:flagellar hook protein FlgE
MYSSNISSLNAHTTWMNVNANNVANVNTDKFTPTDTIINEGKKDNPTATLRKSDSSGTENTSGTNLAKELTDQIVVQDATGFNVSAIKTQNDMTKTLLDIKA